MKIDKLDLLKDIRSGRLRVDEALARLGSSRLPSPPPPPPEEASQPLGERLVRDLMLDITDLLKIEPGEINPDTPLMSLGVDSIGATEFIGRFAKRYGIKLPPTVLFEFRDVRGFAEHVVAHHREKLLDHYGAATLPASGERATTPVAAAPPRSSGEDAARSKAGP